MLQGDAIREITLEGPGAGGLATASAVVADMVSVIGTTGTGFLQNDACWRTLERLPPGDLRSPFYLRVEVDDRPGVLAHVAECGSPSRTSRSRGSTQRQSDGSASLDLVTHEARQRQRRGGGGGDRGAGRGSRRAGGRSASSPSEACDGRAHRALPRPAPGRRVDSGRLAGRGRDAAAAGAAALRAARTRRLAQVRGREPDRLVQGSWDDGRRLARGRARRACGRVRVDREHRGVGCRLRGPRRALRRDPAAGGGGRARQARASSCGRSARARGARVVRRGAPARRRSSRHAARTRS